MMMGYEYGGALGMGVGMLFNLVFLTMMAFAVIWLYKAVFYNRESLCMVPSTSEILRQRFARGEITEEEYRRIRNEIQ
jgi:putative membrane protein